MLKVTLEVRKLRKWDNNVPQISKIVVFDAKILLRTLTKIVIA